MKRKLPALLLLTTLLMTGCQDLETSATSMESVSETKTTETQSVESVTSVQSVESVESSDSVSDSADTPVQEDVASPVSADFKSFFDIASDVKITLDMPKTTLDFLDKYQSQQNAKFADAYVPCDITISLNGVSTSLTGVGVRMKGNTSRGHILNGDGRLETARHYKLNFGATFDSSLYDEPELASFKRTYADKAERSAIKDRNIYGLEKLDLKVISRNSRNNDACELREVYAYQSFRDQGLMAPYANLCQVTLNNKDGGDSLVHSYEIIEPIDKQFLKRRFSKDNAKGDLYKCVYNSMGKADLSRSGALDEATDEKGNSIGTRKAKGKIGVEDNFKGYVPCYQLKTNDDGEKSDFSKMAGYLNAMWNVTFHGNPISELEAALDVDQFLRFSAVSYALGNPDDQRYNFNNYYIYFNPANGRAMYIPYDFDWCLGLSFTDDMSTKTPFDTWTCDGDAANVFYATFFKADKNGGRISYSRADMQNRYADYVKGTKDILDSEKFKAMQDAARYDSDSEYGTVKSYMDTKKTKLTATN